MNMGVKVVIWIISNTNRLIVLKNRREHIKAFKLNSSFKNSQVQMRSHFTGIAFGAIGIFTFKK